MVRDRTIRDILDDITLRDPQLASCREMAIAQAVRDIRVSSNTMDPHIRQAVRRLRRGGRASNGRVLDHTQLLEIIEDRVKWALYLSETGDRRLGREYLKAMGPKRGRPSEVSRRSAIRKLAIVYSSATGQQPRLLSWNDKYKRYEGAFFRFCRSVFDLAGGHITDSTLGQAVNRALRGWRVPEPATWHVLEMLSAPKDF